MSRAAPSYIATSTTWPTPDWPALEDRAEEPDREQHPATAVVAEEIERRNGSVLGADGVERAGEREVVDVVPRHLRVRAVLTPARHARVDEPRVAREQVVGSDAEAFRGAGTVDVDERVGVRGECVHDVRPRGCFMSTAMDRWLRRINVSIGGGWSTSVTRSTRTTSAPRPPSSIPQKGAGPRPPIMTTRVPVSGPLISWLISSPTVRARRQPPRWRA